MIAAHELTDEARAARATRRLRVCYFNTWADGLEPAASYLARLPELDLPGRVANPGDAALLRKARLDCDWYGENLRCFAAMRHREFEVVDAQVCGVAGLLPYAKASAATGDERWLIVMAHQPQAIGPAAPRVFALLRQAGVRVLYYAFDEASRFMPCFRDIAPHIDVLIHDEDPLNGTTATALRPECVRIHRSWVANFIPYAAPFVEEPEPRILFLGSALGLSDHRQRQIAFLERRFKDRFVASHDHSIGIADRLALNRFKVGFCPEGRKFSTPAMAKSHTDRPFWCGCLGMVPVSEDSAAGGRLEELASAGMIRRYPHADLETLAETCERALETPADVRRKIYEHFNACETVGAVVADAIANFPVHRAAAPGS